MRIKRSTRIYLRFSCQAMTTDCLKRLNTEGSLLHLQRILNAESLMSTFRQIIMSWPSCSPRQRRLTTRVIKRRLSNSWVMIGATARVMKA